MLGGRIAASLAGSLAVLCAAASTGAQTVRPLSGPVIVTRTSPAETSLMWDATPYVTQLVNEKMTDARGLYALEATALTALAERAKTLRSRSLSVTVTYARTGDVSPVYGSATFAGFEQVLRLGAKRADVVAHAGAWSRQLSSGTTPRGVALAITGKLPPPQ